MNEDRLYRILGYKRAHDSLGERLMREEVLMPYSPTVFLDQDEEPLAYALENTMPDGSASRTLFSAHLDTVHYHSSKLPDEDDVVNVFRLDASTNTIHASGDVLGADDGAGIWLLLEMYDAGVPGTYIFHRGEECGGIGSRGMSIHHWGFLTPFERAIAFDRKATHSIITHQRGRCCSDEFANALADALTCDTYFMAPDSTGVFTDTANYTDDIAECTNVSVGYYDEHHTNERLDLSYLFALRDKCIAVDWESLPTVRKPGEVDISYIPYSFKSLKPVVEPEFTAEDLMDMEFLDILEMCEQQPYEAAIAIYTMIWGQPPSQEEQGIVEVVEVGDHYDTSGTYEIDITGGGEACAGFSDIWDDDWDRFDTYPGKLKVGLQ